MVRRTTDGAGQQVGNAFLKNLVFGNRDRVEKTLTFQDLVNVRCGKGGVPSEVAAQVPFPITLNDRFQNSRQPSALWTLPGEGNTAPDRRTG